MNKTRRTKHKSGTFRRLSRESLVLSCTRALSSFVNRIFETGFLSPIFRSMPTVDSAFHDRVTEPLRERVEIKKKFITPVRHFFASFVANNRLFTSFYGFVKALMASSLRSVGVFFITFSFYSSAIFLLKRYLPVTLGVASADDLSVSAVALLVGLLLTAFGDKSIFRSLSGGRTTGVLLSEHLGMNPSALDHTPKRVGITVGVPFLLGSVLGVLTLFYSPARALFGFFLALIYLAIFYIPELGLMISAMTFSFIPVGHLAIFATVTCASYISKCIRLKRNFRLGTADAVMLLTFVSVFVASVSSDGAMTRGEGYLLVFMALYFAAKNLICSERLISQAFNSLTLGLNIGMTLYILGAFARLIPHGAVSDAAVWLTRFCLPTELLAVSVFAVLPIALSTLSSSRDCSSNWSFVLLAIACAAVSDSYTFFVLLLVSASLYVVFAYKASVGTALFAAAVFPPVLELIGDFTSAAAVDPGANVPLDALLRISDGSASGFYGAFELMCGSVTVFFFIPALVLVVYRTVSSALLNSVMNKRVIFGCVAAAQIALVIAMFVFNPFSDLRTTVVFWFIFGMSGSVRTYLSTLSTGC